MSVCAKLAKKHNLAVISDEIYEYFVYGTGHFSIGSIYPQTLTFNGFSKAYAMTGWRVGYIAGPTDIIDAINRLQQYVVFSTSSVSQKAALAALLKNPKKLTMKYRGKRDVALKYLEPSFEVRGAEGAFFGFLRLPAGVSDLEFTKEAARHGVILLPSRVFSQRTDYVRLSYATSHQLLVRGLKRTKLTLTKLLHEKEMETGPPRKSQNKSN